jgi:hypothetical protein
LLRQVAEPADPPAARSEVRLAMLAQGRPLDDSVLAVLISDAAALKEWLLARLDSDPTLADCELRYLVQAVSLTTATTDEAHTVRSVGRAGSELVELLIRFMTDCVCAAFNPPCEPCDDTDVLLACLEVRDCEVVRTCNAVRDYVISGSALRYWLPVGLLHEGVESFCCRAEPCRGVAKAEPGRLAFQESGFGISEPAAGVPWKLLGLPQPADLLRSAFQRAGVTLAGPAAPPSPAPSAPSPTPPAAVKAAADATAQQVTALTERVDELTDQLAQTRTRLTELTSQFSASPGPASPGPASPGPASPGPASPGPASPGPSTEGARSPAGTGKPPAGPGSRGRRTGSTKAPADPGQPSAGPGSPGPSTDDAQGPADAGQPPADPGTLTAGSDSPEASNDT